MLSATHGVVLEYRGEPIDAVYHAQCAERVYAAHEIWGGKPHPYLNAVELPESLTIDKSRQWSRRLSRTQVDPLFRLDPQQRPEYRLEHRGGQLGVRVVPGEWWGIDSFRLTIERALGWNTLRSNRFTITTQGDDLLFDGLGFGHLVGLCQRQAAQLARKGWGYEEILHLFYPNTRLWRIGS